MAKKLSEMTLEELWQLFPIFLTPHNPLWKDWFAAEKALLEKAVPQFTAIHHIGSTAIPSIWAKPIIDILAEVPPECDFEALKPHLFKSGYILMNQSAARLSFNKGYTPEGFAEKVFHLHIRRAGDHDEIFFRDYMNRHPAAAREYETLKLSLWKKYEHDRDQYTNAKTELVQKYTLLAKENNAHGGKV